MTSLKILQGPEIGKKFDLVAPLAVIGRSPECDVVLDVAAVSRRHASIELGSGQTLLRDHGSRNGTYVNGQRVVEVAELRDGDQVLICDVLFEFRSLETAAKLGGASPTASSLLAPMAVTADEGEGSSIMATLDVGRGASSTWQTSAKPETQLQAILEISHNLGKTLDEKEILPKVLDSLFKIFVQADRGFVIRRPVENGPLAAVAAKARRGEEGAEMRFSRTIVEKAMNDKQAILSADASSDSRFNMAQSIADFSIRSLICAPLIDGDGEALGVLQIDTSDQRARFTEQDLRVLAGVANQAAIAMDNARMHESIMRQQALERDLELAREMQRTLLPSKSPDVPGYHFFQHYESAYQVGGDYYDYIALPEDRFAAVVGDVAGKGVSAAIIMAKLSSDVRFWLARESDPVAAVNKINAAFCAYGWDDRFVTMILAIVDPKTNEMTLVNAGHMPPLLRTATGTVEEIGGEEAGLPLGVMDDYEFEAYRRPLAAGEFLTMFTDGFSEAMNRDRELFGLERLAELAGNQSVTSACLGPYILEEVRKFAGSFPQSDDMCLVCFGRE
ncbi:MAG: SpoIIE family protein phosphatase [Planctomycetales bacterium]|nr:SpoIIE family protein phosphatase [Planctomycetales bacterium]